MKSADYGILILAAINAAWCLHEGNYVAFFWIALCVFQMFCLVQAHKQYFELSDMVDKLIKEIDRAHAIAKRGVPK